MTPENTNHAQPVSLPRVLLGGLLAGAMIDSIQYLSDALLYPHKWEAVSSLLSSSTVSSTTAPAFEISPRLILFVLQGVGLIAGVLAVRFGCNLARSRKAYLLLAATGAWTLTFGFVSAILVWLLKGAANPVGASTASAAALSIAAILAFAIFAWIGVLAGAAFGCWIYRESEIASGQVANA
ncbi:MAG TPA: hypothetical protein VHD85_15580 [Terracidiphilus sp.]|nr:hypothetical protein [Terracidiphilus sp.]